MFEESLLINQIQTVTGYSTDYAEENTLQQIYETLEVSNVPAPKVYVGHTWIKTHGLSINEIYFNGFRELDNEQILITAVQFICRRQDFITVRTNIFNACSGFNPFPLQGDYSLLGFLESERVAAAGKKIWWKDYFGFSFPRLS